MQKLFAGDGERTRIKASPFQSVSQIFGPLSPFILFDCATGGSRAFRQPTCAATDRTPALLHVSMRTRIICSCSSYQHRSACVRTHT